MLYLHRDQCASWSLRVIGQWHWQWQCQWQCQCHCLICISLWVLPYWLSGWRVLASNAVVTLLRESPLSNYVAHTTRLYAKVWPHMQILTHSHLCISHTRTHAHTHIPFVLYLRNHWSNRAQYLKNGMSNHLQIFTVSLAWWGMDTITFSAWSPNHDVI